MAFEVLLPVATSSRTPFDEKKKKKKRNWGLNREWGGGVGESVSVGEKV